MKFAYADPPYIGCGHRYPEKREVNHLALIERLVTEFPDGWALSCSTPSLKYLLSLCPDGTRVAAWVKPFAIFKPGVNPSYSWEPVLFRGGRKRTRQEPTVKDFHSENITLKKGLVGVKPPGFNRWLLSLLGVQRGDTFIDLFPGSGSMAVALTELELIP